jgi:hypothetical protein
MSALANIPAICCHLAKIFTRWLEITALSVFQLRIQPTVDILIKRKEGFYSKNIKQNKELYCIHYLAMSFLSSNYIRETDAVFNPLFSAL